MEKYKYAERTVELGGKSVTYNLPLNFADMVQSARISKEEMDGAPVFGYPGGDEWLVDRAYHDLKDVNPTLTEETLREVFLFEAAKAVGRDGVHTLFPEELQELQELPERDESDAETVPPVPKHEPAF